MPASDNAALYFHIMLQPFGSIVHRLRTWGEALLDALLPPRARSARTKQRTICDIPLSPVTHELLGSRITALMDYRQPAVQDLIQALKYDRSDYAARLAAHVLADFLREEIHSRKIFSAQKIILAPIPLHSTRMRERGYNQITKVLEALPREFHDGSLTHVALNALVRTRATPRQTHLPRHERLSNVAGAFALHDQSHMVNAHIVLIDDVVTTGATLIHAKHVFRSTGLSVSLIALARA